MTTIIRAHRLIDGTGQPPVENAEVQVNGSQISYAGPAKDAPQVDERDSATYDFGDATILPGLIDCHAHVVSAPDTRPVPEARLKQAVGDRRDARRLFADGADITESSVLLQVMKTASNLKDALSCGMTTMRVPGAPHKTGFAARRAVETGLVEGPRLVVCGPILCPTGGHGHSSGIECDGPDDVRRRTRELLKLGADFIKVTATGGGTAGTPRHRATFTVEELRVIAEEAERQDSYVTAHCHAIEGIQHCLDAGVPMIEHCTFVDRDGGEHFDRDIGMRIRDTGTVVVPTVEVHARWLEEYESRPLTDLTEEEQRLLRRRQESFKRRLEVVHELNELGVKLLIGSDAGLGRDYNVPFEDLGLELQLHVEAGVAPMDAICGATGEAARYLGIGDETGSVQADLEADLMVAPGDPLADIKVLQEPQLVMQAGKVVREAQEVSR